jgi:protein-S-isoprenylcysteine O-methyltransferase Ste14
MASTSVQGRVDHGRVIMVPAAFTVLLVLDVAAITHRIYEDPARWPGVILTCAFYMLMIWCYLRRGQAVATSGSVTGYAAAVVATPLPFAIPLFHGAAPTGGRSVIVSALVLVAGAWEIWSLRSLGRSLSIIAQARQVVDRGPYKWIRHPLYAGEITASLALAIAAGTAAAFGIWLVLCGLQAYRAVREEQVLLQALPGYRSYRARTAALLPGVF